MTESVSVARWSSVTMRRTFGACAHAGTADVPYPTASRATAPHSPRPRRRCNRPDVTATTRTEASAFVQPKEHTPPRAGAERETGQTRERLRRRGPLGDDDEVEPVALD